MYITGLIQETVLGEVKTFKMKGTLKLCRGGRELNDILYIKQRDHAVGCDKEQSVVPNR